MFQTMRVPLRVHAVALLIAMFSMFAAACSDLELFSPDKTQRSGILAIQPEFSLLGTAVFEMADISRIRLTIREKASGRVVDTVVKDVNPADPAWNLDIEVPQNVDLEVITELLSVVGGTEKVEFSGKIDVKVTPNGPPPVTKVPVVPGGIENLNVTSLTIAPRDQSLLETETLQLSATAGGVTNPTIVWASKDAAVATVSATGLVTAKAPGKATIIAQAGTKTDEVTVTVGARATSIAITPGTATATSINSDVTFTGKVLDVRNTEVSGLGITWSIADGTIATQMSPGVFRARRNGTTTITATATQNGRAITQTATLVVSQRATTITISPASKTFASVGETETFTAAAKDANGNDVTGVAFTWTSSNAAVASVDNAGVVTAQSNGGPVTISVSGAGNSAQASVTVAQVPASLTLSTPSLTLTYAGQTERVTATVRDARGNPMDVGVRWFVAQNPTVATVSSDGEITANVDGFAVVIAEAGRFRMAVGVTVKRVVTQIVFNKTSVELQGGETVQIVGQAADAGGTPVTTSSLAWTSLNPNIATVTSTGLIRGISVGETRIQAESNGITGFVTVNVRSNASGSGVLSGPLRTPPFKVLVLSAYGGTSYGLGHLAIQLVGASNVTVVNGTQFEAMSTAQLQAYDVIAVASGAGGNNSGALSRSSARWTAAVTGNVLLTGLHADEHSPYKQTDDFVYNALRFGASGGGTGFIAFTDYNSRFNWLPQVGNFVGITVPSDYSCYSSDAVTITEPTANLFTGITEDGLSYWHNSVHNCFTTTGGLTSVAYVDGNASHHIVLVGKLH